MRMRGNPQTLKLGPQSHLDSIVSPRHLTFGSNRQWGPVTDGKLLVMRRPSVIPMGSWPRRMPAELAAGFCGEATVEAFIKRVGTEYPQPRIKRGGVGYGSGTISISRSCRPTFGRFGTSRRTCDFRGGYPVLFASSVGERPIGFYWDPAGYYRKLGCSIPREPLGSNYLTACGEDGNGGRAAALDALFEEWRSEQTGNQLRAS